ncbi:MAG TPA: PAS domain S-box protein, partial [Lacipirellula sp.]
SDFDMEYRLAREDGTYVWMHDRAKTVLDAEDKPRYLAGACMDVTERKQSELRGQFFARLDEALRPMTDPAEITATAARHLGEQLRVDRCAYAEVHADEDTFDVAGEYNRNAPSMMGRYRFSQFGREVWQYMRENRAFVINDINSHEPPLEDTTAARTSQIYASICVPLHKHGRFVGAMAVHQSEPRRWTADEVELTQAVVNRCWESMERSRVTRSLQESEKKFRQLADFVPMIVWEARPDGVVDYYNERWYEFSGFDRSLTGDPAWAPLVHPDDRQRVHDVWYEAVRAAEPYQVECRLRDSRTGGYRWFMGRALPVKDSEGNVIRWFGTTADIHEAKLTEQSLRANEERIRAIIQATPECVKLISRDGQVLEINASGLQMLEAESPDAVQGCSILEFIAPAHRQKWMENHERICMGENRLWEFEVIGFSGRRRWMESHGVPVTMPEGELAHLCITRDVTDLKRHEAERDRLLYAERAARAEAEQVSRLKDEFLSTLSHELRTPLNAILGYATLIRMAEMSGKELDEATAIIERNAKLQAQLIDDLLDMNRIISGKVQLKIQTASLADVIEAALESARPMADAKQIRLETVVDPMAGPVRGDPDRLRQVIWNLLSNAIKFTPQGGLVQVALEASGSRIEVSVTDSGEGIAPDFLPHVFDQFRQADASTTRKHGGLGLGLSIVKHLVEVHGGAVRAQSDGKGKGATFTVSLPVAAVLDPDDVVRRVQAASTPDPICGTVDLSGVQVLAVDDEPDACVLVKRVLEECHAEVEIAASVREALELIESRDFDVLVSDIGMPIEDGYDLMRTVRSMQGGGAQMRAVALTAFARPEDRQRAALAGFHKHVSKPVEAGELISIVADLTGRAGD